MKNMKRYSVMGLASLELVAMMMLLASGCGTIDQGLIDQAQAAIDHWLDRKTNAPPASVDVPLPPTKMPAWDVKHFAAAGNVNWWGQSNPDVELDKLLATGIPAYHIELFGWGVTHGYDDASAVIASLAKLKAACIARNLRLIVSVCNDNQGILKHGNTDGRKLKDFRNQITSALTWLRDNQWPGLYIQPVAETQTDAGREIEAQAAAMFPRSMLIFNGDGGAPKRIPSWAFISAYHKSRISDSMPRGYWDSSDHGTMLGEFGGTTSQDYKDDKVEDFAKRAAANDSPCILYMFQQRVMSVSDLVALHRGYYGAPVIAQPPVTEAAVYEDFKWQYGGFKGGGATLDTPRIKGLQVNGQKLAYSWAGADLSDWGLGHDQAGALACLFVQLPGGEWVGGKFEWISTSRTSRTLEHCEGYNGWTLAGVPNPCKAAFVIVAEDGKRRSNVLVADWRR